MASPYVKGRKVEYKVKDVLEELGFYVVRAAASRGLFDLVAIDPAGRRILLVQVKATERGVPKKVREEMVRFKGTYTVTPVYTVKKGDTISFVEVGEEP